MNKKIIVLGIISMFLLSSNVAVSTISSLEIKTANANDDWDIIVDDDGGEDYTSIQEAIDNAWPDARILVKSGNYESIDVDIAGLTIHGENKINTYIDGSENYVAVDIESGETNISGFTIMNGEYGIQYGGSYNIITENIVKENNKEGMGTWEVSSYNVITENIVKENNNGGIEVLGSYNVISNNIITNHNDRGIMLDGRGNTNYNTITNNIIKNNGAGVAFLWENASHNDVSDNTISDNGDGIWIWLGGSYNNIFRNNITDNKYGIHIRASYGTSNNIISDNTISNNENTGIWIGWDASYNQVFRNNITDNKDGIILDDSHNNSIYHNNLINNSENNAYDRNKGNIWDDGTGKGNYWDDYIGVDLNPRDRIGDSPYKIKDDDLNPFNNSEDRYPLMKPYPNVKSRQQSIKSPFLNFLENHPILYQLLQRLLKL